MSKNIESLLSERQAKMYMENYIAMDSIKNKKVLAYGKNAVEVYREASSKGHKYFFVIYIPKNQVHIY